MGMDLMGADLSYNWGTWRRFVTLLDHWSVDIDEFKYTNDGHQISARTCMAVADAIEAHLDDDCGMDRKWLREQIPKWRYCGGCLQY